MSDAIFVPAILRSMYGDSVRGNGYFLMPGYFDGIATILLGPFVGGFLGMLGRLVILRINRR